MHRILVVDNNAEALETLRDAALAGIDREVVEADSATSAIEKVMQQEFDVVVTDLNMESGDAGLRVLRAAQKCDPLTQVIVVTAYSNPETNKQALELGAFEFLDRIAERTDFFSTLERKIDLAIKFRQGEISRRQVRDEEGDQAPSTLSLNVWFPDYAESNPILTVGTALTLRVNIGPIMTKCLIPDHPDSMVKSLHLLSTLPHVDILVACAGAKVDSRRKRLVLPPGPKASVNYIFTPLKEGLSQISVAILVANEAIHRAGYTVEVGPAEEGVASAVPEFENRV